ncbi:MAG: hypothetical protein M1495_18635, partial [Bacteroidetes bacterium]|nr:hypothetical protein [Bacteroidota bacterium]
MNEENSLSFEIRARVLPMLEGADQLVQQLQALPAQISSRMNQTVQSPAFQEGLTPQQIQKVENFTSGKDVFEFQKIQEYQRQFAEDLDIDISSGKITKSTQGKWQKKFRKQGGMIEGFAEDLTEQLNEPYFDFLGPDKKKMLLGAMNEGAAEAVENVEKLGREFERVAESINKSHGEVKSFFETVRSVGLLTMAGVAVDAGMNYWLQGKRIEAAERTSFSFGSPMEMYS